MKRYPKSVILAYARENNTLANAEKMEWLDSGGYEIGTVTKRLTKRQKQKLKSILNNHFNWDKK